MIVADCPHCRFSKEVRKAFLGRSVTCPKCLKQFVIGEAPNDTKTPAASDLLDKIFAPENPGNPVGISTREKSGNLPLPQVPSAAKKPSPPSAVSIPGEKRRAEDNETNPNASSTPGNPTMSYGKSETRPPGTVPPTLKNAGAASKKIPNPLKPPGGLTALCPTLQTQEEFDRYRKMLLDPIQKPMPVEKMSGGYKFGLFLLAVFMVLLPLVYVLLVGGMCALEYFYFALTFSEFSANMEKSGKGGIVLAVLYFAFPLGLAAVILILLKPLVFGWGGKDTRFEISPEREPLLFDFVQYLCRCIGAPMPKRIFVDCRVNAAAGLTRGIRGAVFGGNECDLIIGLPLVAGMSTSGFAGILAHEFGHFTQAGTRRMDYIVRTVLWWFTHIYYYRDRTDAWLRNGARIGDPRIAVFFWIILFFVWAARRLIWVMMTLGNLAAGYMSRQMEYDADGYEVRLVGSKTFKETAGRLIMLNIANDKTVADLNYMLEEERLCDNYPVLIAANMRILDEKLRRWTAKIIREGKTGFADTHPCDRDRIAAAERMNRPGVLHIDLPASLLFRNFLGLSREVSLHFYRNENEMQIEPGMLKNSGTVTEQLQRENLGEEAIVNLFQRSYYYGQFLNFRNFEPSPDSRSASDRLRQARDRQAACAVDCLDAVKAFEKTENKLRKAIAFRELVRIGVRPDMSEAGFSFRKLGEANLAVERFRAEAVAHSARLWNRDAVAAERLFAARELLNRKEIQDRIEDGESLCRRLETLFPILARIGETASELDDAREQHAIVSHWLNSLATIKRQDQAYSLFQSIEQESDIFKRLTKRFQMLFSDTPYPYEHNKRETTFGRFLVPEWKEVEMGPLEYYQAFGTLLTRLLTSYHLMLGEWCAVALAVEQALGLTPLPVPPPEEDIDSNQQPGDRPTRTT